VAAGIDGLNGFGGSGARGLVSAYTIQYR